MKQRFSVMLTLSLILALALTFAVSAEFVACTDGTGNHDMSEWSVVTTNDDGSTTLERTCSICGYVQKGFQGGSGGGGATTKAGDIAVTLSDSIPVPADPTAPDAAAPATPELVPEPTAPSNPGTGARI